jgi:hypothetical protein
MENKIVNHVVYGKGTVLEVIERNDPIYVQDADGTNRIAAMHKIESLVSIKFEDGTIRQFQDRALKEPKWFIQE